MKKILMLWMSFGILLVGSYTFATDDTKTEDVFKANLSVPVDIGKAQCVSEQGKGTLPIFWKGVSDKRKMTAIGVLNKRGEEVDVVTVQPVTKLLEDGMKSMLKRCGFTFAKPDSSKGIEVSVDITEFFAGSKKGLVIGKTDAQGAIKVYVKSPTEFFEFQYSASKENKGLKKKNIAKLESALNEVMTMMIEKVASNSQFADAMKKLSQ